MNSIRLSIVIACAALVLSGCGKEMTIVKAYPGSGAEAPGMSGSDWKASYKSGQKFYNKREFHEALSQFDLALQSVGENDENRARIYFSIGQCWEKLKVFSRAEQNYLMAQDLDPDLTDASNGLARIAKLRAQK